MPQYVRAKVTGEASVRDVLTREPVEPGGEVVLLVREPGPGRVSCSRHPRKGVNNAKERCLCGGTLLEPLLEQGVIGDVKPYDPDKAEKAKA